MASLSSFAQSRMASANAYDWRIPAFEARTAANTSSEDRSIHRRSRIISVPSADYPTIQSAIGAAPIIEVAPGVYRENIHLANSVSATIRAKIPGSVIIDGGDTANTIDLAIYATVRLENLTLINTRPRQYYDTATVFGWGGVAFTISNCTIYSKSIGVSSSYAFYTTIVNSKFIGLADDAVGAMTSLQAPIGPNSGTRLFDNHFMSLDTGIYHYDIGSSVRLIRCQGRECSDSNRYSDVNTPYFFTDDPGV